MLALMLEYFNDYKDLLQLAVWISGVLFGAVAAFKAIYEIRKSREQREHELHWKKTLLAREMLEEFFKDAQTSHAMTLLDWDGRRYEIEPERKETIRWKETLHALRPHDASSTFSAKEVFVRDVFDRFFTKLEFINHYITQGLVEFGDVRAPLGYYVKRMVDLDRPVFQTFLDAYDYDGALEFCERFEVWKSG